MLLTEARMGSRRILARLSGNSLNAEPSTFEAFVLTQPELAEVQLPPPMLSFGN